jgi:hypothetical protein
MNKKRISILLNILIVFLEIIGFVITYVINKKISIEFYTEDSNILALITSSIFVIYMLNKKEIPRWLKLLKYATTICLSVTFIVVIFILAPMYNFNYPYLLFYNSLLYQHLLCPILSIITFTYFDNLGDFNIKDNFTSLSLTLLYAIILIILNILKLVIGPYPFLMVYEQSILISIIWFIIIFTLAYLIGYMLRVISKNK